MATNGKYIGTHVAFSRANVRTTAKHLKDTTSTASAIFTKAKIRYTAPKFSEDVPVKLWNAISPYISDKSMLLSHAGYAINLSSDKKENYQKSIEGLDTELMLASQLGINVVVHPGTSKDISKSIKQISNAINKVYKKPYTSCIFLETMPMKHIGCSFEELAAIISLVEDKSKVGICFDTCHMYLAGMPMQNERDIDDLMKRFESTVGIQYLRAAHINNSAIEAPAIKDKHAPILDGYIKDSVFKYIMRDRRFNDIPLVTETHMASNKAKIEIELLRKWASQ